MFEVSKNEEMKLRLIVAEPSVIYDEEILGECVKLPDGRFRYTIHFAEERDFQVANTLNELWNRARAFISMREPMGYTRQDALAKKHGFNFNPQREIQGTPGVDLDGII